MKLAEALQERADLNRKIEQLARRIQNSALAQEGERPPEDPQQLKQELDTSIERLAHLIACINRTNTAVTVDGQTLTQLIARKDALTLKIQLYKEITSTGSQAVYRARNTEIKILPAISVPAWQGEIDQMARDLRLLDNTLQACNWNTDLME